MSLQEMSLDLAMVALGSAMFPPSGGTGFNRLLTDFLHSLS